MDKKYHLLKVLVGSQAHGVADLDSDYDYRGVFIIPTKRLLQLGNPAETTAWIEGKDDNTSWEIFHFLNMAVHCNPTIMEVFMAPIVETQLQDVKLKQYAKELRNLFPYVWNSNDVKNAFIGYGINQRKKFLDNKDDHEAKYASAYLRVLYQAWELLSTGRFSVNMAKTPIFDVLKRFRKKEYSRGEVVQTCWEWETEVLKAFKANPDKKTNIEPINEFLLKIRKEFWI